MELGLRGKTAVVTGASKGIGLAVARALAAEGVDLAISARSAEVLQREAKRMADAHGIAVHPYPTDLSTAEGISGLAAFATERMGRVDILVNNAGAIPAGTIEGLDDETWHRAYDLKLWGYVRLAKALLPAMKERGSGVILNIIGNAGKKPSAGYIAGGIANAGLMNFTAGLAHDASVRHSRGRNQSGYDADRSDGDADRKAGAGPRCECGGGERRHRPGHSHAPGGGAGRRVGRRRIPGQRPRRDGHGLCRAGGGRRYARAVARSAI